VAGILHDPLVLVLVTLPAFTKETPAPDRRLPERSVTVPDKLTVAANEGTANKTATNNNAYRIMQFPLIQ
jgi:hypothetical protein